MPAPVVVIDPESSRIVHTLTLPGGGLAHGPFAADRLVAGGLDTAAWLPSGHVLAVARMHLNANLVQVEGGMLSILNVWEDKIVAEVAVSGREWAPIAFHPTLNRLVLGCGATIQDATPFAKAGILHGSLPRGCGVSRDPGLGFSKDGHHYISSVFGGVYYNDEDVIPEDIIHPTDLAIQCSLFKCAEDGFGRLHFTLIHHMCTACCSWVPHLFQAVTNAMTQMSEAWQYSHVLDLATGLTSTPLGAPQAGVGVLEPPLTFSRGQRFVCDASYGPRIFSMESGRLLWCMYEIGDMVDDRTRLLRCCWRTVGWLPSGRGMICLTQGSIGVNAVHVVTFAWV